VVTIRYRDDRCELAPSQSVLDALLERGHDIPHSCRNATCQTCLMRTVEGTPPADSQKDLGPALRMRGHFLACVCRPDEDLIVALPAEGESTLTAVVRRLEPLNADILRVDLTLDAPFDYRAGQFLNLFMDEMLGRSYSLASVPELDEYLELHVRRLPDGRVSGWIHDELRVVQTLAVRGPGGNCFYMPGQPEQPLLLIGTGSSLAPLYGILRDALRHGHTGPIRLFHGSRSAEGLYLKDELRELAGRHANLEYVPCISGADIPHDHTPGRADDVALTGNPDLQGWRVYLCGHPDMVQQAQMRAYLAGASLQEIHADAFHAERNPAGPLQPDLTDQ
jgi:NAD(P)H-flavin reductase/ferredoxin